MDPRCAIAGREAGFSDSSGASLGADAGWESGLFDRGSWIEAQVRISDTHKQQTVWLPTASFSAEVVLTTKSTTMKPYSTAL